MKYSFLGDDIELVSKGMCPEQEVLGINILHTGVMGQWGSGGLTKDLEVMFFLAQISILWVHVAWYGYVLCY
jgi:hypothetical protein